MHGSANTAVGDEELERHLLDLAVLGRGWPAILGALSVASDRPTRLIGTFGGLFAASDAAGRAYGSRPPQPGVPADDSTQEGVDRATVAAVLTARLDSPITCNDGFVGLAVPVQAGERRIGLLVMGDPVGPRERALIEAALLPVAVEAGRRDAEARVRAERGAAFIGALRAGGHTPVEGLARVAAHWDLDLNRPYAGIVLGCRRPHRAWASAASWIEQPVMIDGDRCFTLWNGEPGDQMSRIRNRLEAILGLDLVVAAAGPIVTGPRRAADTLQLADLVLQHLGDREREASYDDLGARALLLSVTPGSRSELVQAQLGDLMDRRDLLITLQVWLDSGQRRDETAARLGIHRNSLTKRLERAAQLLPRDSLDEGTSPDLVVALAALEMDARRPVP